MYSIKSNSRRITTFVKSEAYKWLYDKISKNEYDAKNSIEAQQLLLLIKKEQCVTEDTYTKFVNNIIHNPFSCVVSGYKRKSKFITTRKVENFFVLYNDTPLPVGFIKDFFEDDYETQLEINKYIKSVVSEQENIFVIKAQERFLKKSEKLTETKENYQYFFNTKVLFHVTNIIKMIITVVTVLLCIHFFKENDIIGKVILYFRDGEGEQYLLDNMVFIIFNTLVLLFMIPKVIKLIKMLIFYIIWIVVRIYVFFTARNLHSFEDKNMDKLRNYFQSIIPEIAERKYIFDDLCAAVPSVKNLYLSLEKFNNKKIENRIEKVTKSPKFTFVNIFYKDEATLKIQKSRWKSKIVFPIIIALILAFMNVASWRNFAVDMYDKVVTYFVGEKVISTEDSLDTYVGKELSVVKYKAESLGYKFVVYVQQADVTSIMDKMPEFVASKIEVNTEDKIVAAHASWTADLKDTNTEANLKQKLSTALAWNIFDLYAVEQVDLYQRDKQIANVLFDEYGWLLIAECTVNGEKKLCVSNVYGTDQKPHVSFFEILDVETNK